MYDTKTIIFEKVDTTNGWNPLALIYERSVSSMVKMIFLYI
jgi:hypothetical protein